MHLKPTAGCQLSTFIFGFGGILCIVKGPGNTSDINPKWQRTFPFFSNFSWDMYRVPLIKISKLIIDSLLWA
jgi:hypothetical protein